MFFHNFNAESIDNAKMTAEPIGPFRHYHKATNCYHREPEVVNGKETSNPFLTPGQKDALASFAVVATGVATVLMAVGAAGAVNKHVFGLDGKR